MAYPIVLAHGVCRFDFFWSGPLKIDNSDDPHLDRLHYFKGIRTMLVSKGYPAFHARVSWAAGVDTRAEDLRRCIMDVMQETEKVNIVAHSMGGLDARHMMFNDRDKGLIHKRIASLTTISTPHSGSPFADWGLKNLPPIIPVAARLGLDLHAMGDLTVASCREYNQDPQVLRFEENCEEEGIVFQTYAGRQDFLGVFDALKLPFYIIEKQEGENDGLVSVDSARWRDRYFKGTLDETDHLNELGWHDPAQIWVRESPEHLLERMHKFYSDVAAGLP